MCEVHIYKPISFVYNYHREMRGTCMRKRDQGQTPLSFDEEPSTPLESDGWHKADVKPARNESAHTLAPIADLRAIQRQFNNLHEEIYKKGGVKPTNAAIDEVGKLIFLKLHLEHDPSYCLQTGIGQGKRFADLFSAAYIRHTGRAAVRELQDAFTEISTLPRYSAVDPAGETQTLFPYQEILRLDHPDVLAMAIGTLSSLSLSIPHHHFHEAESEQWEGFVHHDLLGCAYDTFLQGKYDNAGGLGTYLTPSQVVDCMVKMAFLHVTENQLWALREDTNGHTAQSSTLGSRELPGFLVGDICCGTGRFLIRALTEIRNRVLRTADKSIEEKLEWLAKMTRYSVFGADQATSSIVKARINLLMFGVNHPQLLTVEDSILDERIDALAGTFDIILTNPPFGEGKYDTRAGLDKLRRSDLGLELGWSWKCGKDARRDRKSTRLNSS